MKCPVCTQAIADDAPFCQYCGHEFDSTRAAEESRRLEQRARNAAQAKRGEPIARTDERDLLPRLDLGALINESVDVFIRNAIPFVGLCVLFLVPPYLVIVLLVLRSAGTLVQSAGAAAAIALGALGLMILSELLATSLIVSTVVRQRAGLEAGPGVAISTAVSRMGAVLIASIEVGLLSFVAMLACVVPAFIVQSTYAVAVAAAVVEQTPGTDALARSAALTSGYRWTIFWVMLGLGFLEGMATRTGGYAGAIVGGAGGVAISLSINLFIASVMAAFRITFTSVLYCRLREAKQNASPEEVAASL